MAIQTDTNIASVTALLSAFVTFAVANAGFTDEGTDTVGGETLFKISRTTNSILTYWGFVSTPQVSATKDDVRISARMMLSNPTAANWTTLAEGQRLFTYWGAYNLAAPFTGYTFYADGTNVFAILEVRANIFTHLCIGNITKCGTYDGGEFLQADYHEISGGGWSAIDTNDNNQLVFAPRGVNPATAGGGNYVRHDTVAGGHLNFFCFGFEDNADNTVGSGTLSPPSSLARIGTSNVTTANAENDYFGNIIRYSPSSTTNVAPITPCYVTRRDESISLVRIIGFVPNIGAISILNLNPKDIVNTDWKVYPRGQKAGDFTQASVTGRWGLAYKEIP
jgi:hypothetical protein